NFYITTPALRPPLLKEGEWGRGRFFRPLIVSSVFIPHRVIVSSFFIASSPHRFIVSSSFSITPLAP
ncbi:MAG: hypothetical protein J6T87_02025, partial [Bacteroidales bacterium]|nr:hypothetical protein [Bacteroidales bacterium]